MPPGRGVWGGLRPPQGSRGVWGAARPPIVGEIQDFTLSRPFRLLARSTPKRNEKRPYGCPLKTLIDNMCDSDGAITLVIYRNT